MQTFHHSSEHSQLCQLWRQAGDSKSSTKSFSCASAIADELLHPSVSLSWTMPGDPLESKMGVSENWALTMMNLQNCVERMGEMKINPWDGMGYWSLFSEKAQWVWWIMIGPEQSTKDRSCLQEGPACIWMMWSMNCGCIENLYLRHKCSKPFQGCLNKGLLNHDELSQCKRQATSISSVRGAVASLFCGPKSPAGELCCWNAECTMKQQTQELKAPLPGYCSIPFCLVAKPAANSNLELAMDGKGNPWQKSSTRKECMSRSSDSRLGHGDALRYTICVTWQRAAFHPPLS